ncbi:myosin light chain 2, putative [Eimeria brunetti]|uniref:Myosin light chain 2, putative n=1 Tax=Eimeria brunetti TaxID=51314 RepID=U6LM95_9EIME|nr:myosin light chain 2, putative [Eimeria brunetti]
MNLHRVPQQVSVVDVKNKISERLKEVGRNLPADLMILKYGENAETEMENNRPLSFYNTMGLSQMHCQISKRQKFDINVVAVKAETKCLCLKKSAREDFPFPVRVPSTCYVKQLRMEIARRMNCGVDRHDLELFFDAELQKSLTMDSAKAATFARKLGYSPSEGDCLSLPGSVDYKAFQAFLTKALHAEDLAEAFQHFFALFDTQARASGDLSAKQLCNIMQMYGDEPLSKDEANKFTEYGLGIVMGTDKVLPINVVVDRSVG